MDLDGGALTAPESFPGCRVISILKTFFNKGFQLINWSGADDTIANGSWNNEIDMRAVSLFVPKSICVKFLSGVFCAGW
jgi:hypothetical protein